MWDYHCSKKGSTKNENLNENANKIHYAKTLEKIYNTDWNDWIEMHKNNDIDVVYNSFHSLFQSKIVLETRKANRKKPIQPWMTYEILGKKRNLGGFGCLGFLFLEFNVCTGTQFEFRKRR